MRNWRRGVIILLAALFLSGLYISGCAKHPSQEELNALEEAKKAALASEDQLSKKQREKADLEKQLANKKAKLEELKNEKQKLESRLKGE
ncbi:MAG: hypothetical protein ONB05_10430 [candidate division KSB1 bacterium]|nr:hypothetical protein [candidate division KSB1 bacterium]